MRVPFETNHQSQEILVRSDFRLASMQLLRSPRLLDTVPHLVTFPKVQNSNILSGEKDEIGHGLPQIDDFTGEDGA